MSSSTQAADHLRSLDDVDLIVDADSHVTESVDQILPYIDERYQVAHDLISHASDPLSEIFSYAQPAPVHPFDQEDGTQLVAGDAGPQAKKAQLRSHGIDYAVIDPTLGAEVNGIGNTRVAVAWANAYNSFILDTFADHDEMFKVTMVVAPQMPALAAEEIDDRADEDDIVGVHLPPSGLVPPAGHERYAPIYEAAQAHDLPVMFHTVSGTTHLNFPVQHRWHETYAAEHAVVHPFTHMWNFTSLLFEGIPERFPDLDFIVQEAGLGWIPYMTYRLDDHYMENAHELPVLEHLPSEYIADQFTFTSQPLGLTAANNTHIAWFLDMVGAGSVMYSADIPHPDFDPPNELFDRIKSYFDPETVRDIMGRNAVETYGLNL